MGPRASARLCPVMQEGQRRGIYGPRGICSVAALSSLENYGEAQRSRLLELESRCREIVKETTLAADQLDARGRHTPTQQHHVGALR